MIVENAGMKIKQNGKMGNSFYIQETHAGTLAKAGEIMRLFDMNQEGFISRDKFLGVMAVFEIARA